MDRRVRALGVCRPATGARKNRKSRLAVPGKVDQAALNRLSPRRLIGRTLALTVGGIPVQEVPGGAIKWGRRLR